jgi:hypothetical protein
MDDAKITCPECRAEIPLTDTLAGPMLSDMRERMEAERVAALAAQKVEIEGVAVRRAVAAQAAKMAALEVAARDAHEQAAAKLATLEVEAKARDLKLAEAQKAQADALRKERELDARAREMDLELEKRLGAALGAQVSKVRAEAHEAEALKLAEKDQQMDTMRRQIEALKKKSEQGSQQLQGEAAEVLLEERLGAAFPLDALEPVGKGVSGADVLQRVASGAGSILWESKRTANWGPAWLGKLRDDQRAAGADLAVLVSAVRPEGVDSFAQIDGVWVCAPSHALALAAVLRQTLLAVAAAKVSQEGQETKMELVYAYLTGPQFRHRVEAIVEHFEDMRSDLDRERRSLTKQWAKREKQIDGVIAATVGMYGDLEGIAGKAMPVIEGLDLPLLEGPSDL